MYCPKCSQQQVSDEIRFCPRCGFQLDAVKMLLTKDQNNLAMPETELPAQPVSTRKRDILLGLTVMLIAAISIALLTISSVTGTPWQAVIIPLLLVWAAIVSVILLSGHAAREITNLFSKDAFASPAQNTSSLITGGNPATRHSALPPVQSVPVSGFGSWRLNTTELAEPLSVTERTTNSLNKKD
jgi:hypothetical protein